VRSFRLGPELAGFIATLTPARPGDPDALGTAGRALGIEWPPDYAALMAARDGGTGEVAGWPVRLYSAGQLVAANVGGRVRGGEGVVWFGWDGLGEDYGFDRATGRVVLRAEGGEVEVTRESLADWLRHPPDFSDSRLEAVRALNLAEERRQGRG
jgi:hypothetical protein